MKQSKENSHPMHSLILDNMGGDEILYLVNVFVWNLAHSYLINMPIRVVNFVNDVRWVALIDSPIRKSSKVEDPCPCWGPLNRWVFFADPREKFSQHRANCLYWSAEILIPSEGRGKREDVPLKRLARHSFIASS